MSRGTVWQPAAATARRDETLRVLAAAVVVGLAFERLAWQWPPGVGVALALGAFVLAIWFVARGEGLSGHPGNRATLAAGALFSAAVALRVEPLTTASNLVVAAGLTGLAVHSWTDVSWLRYRVRHYLLAAAALLAAAVGGAVAPLRRMGPRLDPRTTEVLRARLLPVVRGLALAVPIVAVFALLLVAADDVFADQVFSLRLPSLASLGRRLLVVTLVTWIVSGLLTHVLDAPYNGMRLDEAGDRPSARLGLTEALIVLGAVNTLFAAFVAVQLRYFFGGHEGLLASGLSYAAYARRGYAELLFVALLSLVLLLALAGLTRREAPRERVAFTVAGVWMTAAVLVMLVSAFQRLLLYEEAFGFTRLRTAVHVSMVWLAVLFVAVLVFELRDRLRLVPLAMAVAAVGFAATMNLVNVDAFIARANLTRSGGVAPVDTRYLMGLSADAVPVLADLSGELAEPLRTDVLAILACTAARLPSSEPVGAWHLARIRARRVLRELKPQLSDFEVVPSARSRMVQRDGDQWWCP